MPLHKPTIVLFDMDGTTVRHLHPKVLSALEALDDAGHKASKLVSKLLRRPIGRPILVESRDGHRPKLLVHRALHRVRRKPLEEIVEPCPGIYGILELLQAQGIPVGLISNGLGKGYGKDILRKFDLARFFTMTIFREDIRRPKPHPDPILQALDKLPRKVEASDVIWFFGDRRKDVLAALAARAHLPCPIEPFAYNLHAAIAILEHNVGTDHIVMAWPDFEPKLRALFQP
jgi:phosphoglycolate phosphatase